ncbi:MAG: 2-oxo acid dehydrogenase subunit E2 [Halochromatium sp.]
MSRALRLQDPGEGLHEAEIVEINVAVGDRVEEGETVLAAETDKATTEIPSPYTGTVERVAVESGDQVRVGDLLMIISGDDGDGNDNHGDSDDSDDDGDAAAPKGEAEHPVSAGPSAEKPETNKSEAKEPSAKEPSAKEPGADEQTAETEQPPAEAGRSATGGDDGQRDQASRDRPVPAAPSTRRIARELDVDLAVVEGSGPGGRVLAEDVRTFAERPEPQAAGEARSTTESKPQRQREEPSAEEPGEEPSAEPQDESPKAPNAGRKPAGERGYARPDFSRWGETEQIALRSIRRTTAREMARSWAQIPHVMHQDTADITALEQFRQAHTAEVEDAGGKLTLTVLVLKALVGALKAYPRFNASLDEDAGSIVIKRYYNIGVAVDTGQGLLVPVVHDVECKSVIELAVELVRLSERAREAKAERDELQGGSFTLTNVGGIGGTLFTPIIRHPEVAILGLGRASLQPIAEGDPAEPTLSAQLRLPLCLGFDHRVNDGADAARFVNRIIAALQDPESLLLTA